jgi:hypothetical protein
LNVSRKRAIAKLVHRALHDGCRRQAITLLTTALVAGRAWLIPNQIALDRHRLTTWGQLNSVALGAIPLGHLNLHTALSIVRAPVPLAIAMGPLLPLVFFVRSPMQLPNRTGDASDFLRTWIVFFVAREQAGFRPSIISVSFESEQEPTLSRIKVTSTAADSPLGRE